MTPASIRRLALANFPPRLRFYRCTPPSAILQSLSHTSCQLEETSRPLQIPAQTGAWPLDQIRSQPLLPQGRLCSHPSPKSPLPLHPPLHVLSCLPLPTHLQSLHLARLPANQAKPAKPRCEIDGPGSAIPIGPLGATPVAGQIAAQPPILALGPLHPPLSTYGAPRETQADPQAALPPDRAEIH